MKTKSLGYQIDGTLLEVRRRTPVEAELQAYSATKHHAWLEIEGGRILMQLFQGDRGGFYFEEVPSIELESFEVIRGKV